MQSEENFLYKVKSEKMLMKLSIIILIIGFLIYSWESPDINHNSKLNIRDCIALDEKKIQIGDFTVSYNENSSTDCINPYFPSIHISFRKQHNAWLHIVGTNHENYKVFIDSVDSNKYPELYPFYQKDDNPYSEFASKNNDFYDAPLWSYRIWHQEVEWVGHAYPIEIDDISRSITFYEGIRWGFKFGNYRLRPQMIIPTVIGKNDIKSDWEIFKTALGGYSLVIVE